jgi:hypothetical protein
MVFLNLLHDISKGHVQIDVETLKYGSNLGPLHVYQLGASSGLMRFESVAAVQSSQIERVCA